MTTSKLTIAYDPLFGLALAAPTAQRISSDHFVWQTYTPEGPGTIAMRRTTPEQVEATSWGPGHIWLIQRASALIGGNDDVDGFNPPPQLARTWKRRPFYIGRTDQVWESLISGVLGQKVQGTKAKQSRRLLARRFGERAPGPYPGWVSPDAQRVANMAYHDFHPIGVERKRAETLLRAAREVLRVPTIAAASPAEFKRRFEQVRGIGPWTTNIASASAFGDADAVPLGDYHFPNTICWALAGEPRGTDERMLELLEPFAGHRYRVIRLAKSTGGAPKFGPRLSLTDDGMYRSSRSNQRRR